MPFFGKERFGKFEVINDGVDFVWKIPNFPQYKGKAKVLDSENVTSFEKTQFHMHMVLGAEGDIGLYLHYKSQPIPKYSYWFSSGGSTPTTQRQHTAHTIPPDTERCGHWNVTTMDEVIALFPSGDDTLYIYFSFDDDTVTMAGSTDVKVEWSIPRILSRNLEPFCSKSFTVDGMVYIARAEIRPLSDECHFFIFNRRGAQIPPHTLVCSSADGTVLGMCEKSSEMGAQILKIPLQKMKDSCASVRSLMVVTIIISASSNPLDILNTSSDGKAMRLPTSTQPSVAAPRTVDISGGRGGKGSQYVVVNADDV